MQTFKMSLVLLFLIGSLSTIQALPAGANNAEAAVQQLDTKKMSKAERKAFKKDLKAKIKQERKRLKKLRKDIKKSAKSTVEVSNTTLIIGLGIGLGLLLLANFSSIIGTLGGLVILAVIILFILRYI